MKPTKHILLLAALLLGRLAASAHSFEVGGIYYNITSEEDLTVAVTYRGNSYNEYSNEYSGAVTIPSTVTYNSETYSVTSIGYYAFYDCRGLTNVTLPENSQLTSIGESAFSRCSNLISITIPESVTSIRRGAFYGCSTLTTIAIPEGVTSFGTAVFSNCINLTSVTLPASMTSIGPQAFEYCSSLSSIAIPESVTSIGGYAFRGCSSLTTITIPENVTSIGAQAFEYCSSLSSIAIPESVTSIGGYAFRGCSLVSVNVAEGNTIYDSRNNCNAIIETSSNTLIAGCASTIIPESVIKIGTCAFSYCSSLTSITIPKSVTSIGDQAFRGCSSLSSITCKAVTPPTIYSTTFYEVDTSIPIYVPEGSVEAYKAAEYWNEFTNIQSLGNEYTLTVSAAGYATLYLDYAVAIPEEVEVYIASKVEGDRLMMTEVEGVLPANTGVIVRAKAGTYTFVESEETPADVEGNLLTGTTTDTYITAASGYRYYVLAQKDGAVGMYRPKLTDGQFLNNANKAYLALDLGNLGIFDDEVDTGEEGGQLSNRLRFDFGGTTSIQNSQFTIQNSQFIYDLHGRRVENPTKGIYIVNGRKEVVK